MWSACTMARRLQPFDNPRAAVSHLLHRALREWSEACILSAWSCAFDGEFHMSSGLPKKIKYGN